MNKKEQLLSGSARRSALTYLSEAERKKYELARELGLLERVKEVGWAGLTAKETGRIGGLIGQRSRKPPPTKE
ncbi:MAG: small, acid-soluble spore protein, alpha/beta type [Clostridia bacterium]